MEQLFVGVDDSKGARRALDWAVGEARLRGQPLTVLRVLPTMTLRLGEAGLLDEERVQVEEGAIELEHKLLRRLMDEVDARGVDITGEVLHDGTVARALVDRTAGSSGIVLGSRGRGGFRSLLLGSVGHQLLHHARCPVVVVPDTDAAVSGRTGGRVVVGVDGSPCSVQALRRAADEARVRSARLDVVVVDDPPPPIGDASTADSSYVNALWGMAPTSQGTQVSRDELEWRREESWSIWRSHGEAVIDRVIEAADLADEGAPKIEPIVASGHHPARQLLDIAEGADLLVLGSRGLGGFRGLLLGSVSQQCVHHATGPVMVLHLDSD